VGIGVKVTLGLNLYFYVGVRGQTESSVCVLALDSITRIASFTHTSPVEDVTVDLLLQFAFCIVITFVNMSAVTLKTVAVSLVPAVHTPISPLGVRTSPSVLFTLE